MESIIFGIEIAFKFWNRIVLGPDLTGAQLFLWLKYRKFTDVLLTTTFQVMIKHIKESLPKLLEQIRSEKNKFEMVKESFGSPVQLEDKDKAVLYFLLVFAKVKHYCAGKVFWGGQHGHKRLKD